MLPDSTPRNPPSPSTGHDSAGLLRLGAELDRRQAEIDSLMRDGAPTDEIDVALDAWWGTVEGITLAPAKTAEGIRTKAMAMRTVMLAIGRDRPPEATALLASLLADLLGEAVELP